MRSGGPLARAVVNNLGASGKTQFAHGGGTVNKLVGTILGLRAADRGYFHRSLIEQPAARPHEKPVEGAAGIIPGNRGMDGRNWCGHPLRGASRAQAYVTSSSGRRRSRSSYATMELCGEPRSRNRVRAESGPGPVSRPAPRQLPRGLRLLLSNQDAALRSGGSTPPKGPAARRGGARKESNAAGSGRVWQSSQNLLLGAARQKRVTQLHVQSNLRVKRSDPSHGANAQPQAAAVPVVKVPARNADDAGVPAPVRRASHRQVAPNRAKRPHSIDPAPERDGTVPL